MVTDNIIAVGFIKEYSLKNVYYVLKPGLW